MTARLDSARGRVFATSADRFSTVRMVSLATGSSKAIVANAVEGVTFGGFTINADGWLLYMRKETNHDVWLFDFGDRPIPAHPPGG